MSLKESLTTRIRHRFHFLPKLSIIIPIYNGEDTLHRCLDSVFWGTHVPIEVICVNDGSSDKSLKILRHMRLQYGCIRIVSFKCNQGLYNARLSGVKHARGKYIGFVDCDDFIEPKYFDKLYSIILQSDADIAVGKIVNQSADGIRYVQSRCARFPYTYHKQQISVYQLYWDQAGKCYHWHVVWNKLYRRELWEKKIDILYQLSDHLIMMEDFIFSSVVLSDVREYVVDDSAIYNYVESVHASTHDYSDFNTIEKKIFDMGRAFSFVENYLVSNAEFLKYHTKFLEWRSRYGRYWRRNILQSDLVMKEKERCLKFLENVICEKIGDIEDEDEFYYEKAEFL